MESLVGFFFVSLVSTYLFCGDLESELSVDVGEPTILNLYSYVYFGSLGVKHSGAYYFYFIFFLKTDYYKGFDGLSLKL